MLIYVLLNTAVAHFEKTSEIKLFGRFPVLMASVEVVLF